VGGAHLLVGRGRAAGLVVAVAGGGGRWGLRAAALVGGRRGGGIAAAGPLAGGAVGGGGLRPYLGVLGCDALEQKSLWVGLGFGLLAAGPVRYSDRPTFSRPPIHPPQQK